MRIGLDFDNTIVCYDEAFYQLAHEAKSIPENLQRTKEQVKAHLQKQGRNDFWTELQGLAYGPRMETASVFPKFEAFLKAMHRPGVELFIVSHRSPKPYSGLDYDLHEAARTCLRGRPWIQSEMIPLKNIFFEATKQGKIKKIAELNLDYFVDDLLDIFTDPMFPLNTKKIHFLPGKSEQEPTELLSAKSWDDVTRVFQNL